MLTADTPFITVGVCTRNRGNAVLRTLHSICENDYPTFEVVVIDQSAEENTSYNFPESFSGRPIRYIHTSGQGLSNGRNLAINHCQGEIIAFTDDDCEVPPEWLRGIAHAFSLECRIGLVFGSVKAGPHDASHGIIPSYEVREPFIAQSIKDKPRIDGMGACMALKKSVWSALSGFDSWLGVGARFLSGEENDFAIRALLADFWIYETPDIHVVHHGFRSREELDRLVFHYMFGTGALFAKHFKLQPFIFLRLKAMVLVRWLFKKPLIKYETRSCRWYRLKCFTQGWWQGIRTPVDRGRKMFSSIDIKTRVFPFGLKWPHQAQMGNGSVAVPQNKYHKASFRQKLKLLAGLLKSSTYAKNGPFYVSLDVTRHCNLQCRGCRFHSTELQSPPDDGGLDDIPLSLVDQLCRELKTLQTSRLYLLGEGEPLLHPQIGQIIRAAKEQGLHITLLTNGTLLNPDRTEDLFNSQLDVLQISLWASSAQEYEKNYPGTPPRQFAKICENLRRVAQRKNELGRDHPSVILHFPINQFNYRGIDQIADLSIETGSNGVSFSPFYTWEGQLAQYALSADQTEEVQKTLRQLQKRTARWTFQHNIRETLLRYRLGEKVSEKLPCYMGWIHAHIRTNGTVGPCAPCDLTFGNLREANFPIIWNQPAFQSFRSRSRTLPGLAEMRGSCSCGFCWFAVDNWRIHRVMKWVAPLSKWKKDHS